MHGRLDARPCERLIRLIYELLDAHDDTARIVAGVAPDPARLQALAAPPDRRQWWIDRIRACYASGRAHLVTE